MHYLSNFRRIRGKKTNNLSVVPYYAIIEMHFFPCVPSEIIVPNKSFNNSKWDMAVQNLAKKKINGHGYFAPCIGFEVYLCISLANFSIAIGSMLHFQFFNEMAVILLGRIFDLV